MPQSNICIFICVLSCYTYNLMFIHHGPGVFRNKTMISWDHYPARHHYQCCVICVCVCLLMGFNGDFKVFQ